MVQWKDISQIMHEITLYGHSVLWHINQWKASWMTLNLTLTCKASVDSSWNPRTDHNWWLSVAILVLHLVDVIELLHDCHKFLTADFRLRSYTGLRWTNICMLELFLFRVWLFDIHTEGFACLTSCAQVYSILGVFIFPAVWYSTHFPLFLLRHCLYILSGCNSVLFRTTAHKDYVINGHHIKKQKMHFQNMQLFQIFDVLIIIYLLQE